jgi:hypothetical protein
MISNGQRGAWMGRGSDADMETENQWADKLAINQPTQPWFCRLESRMEFSKEGFLQVERHGGLVGREYMRGLSLPAKTKLIRIGFARVMKLPRCKERKDCSDGEMASRVVALLREPLIR